MADPLSSQGCGTQEDYGSLTSGETPADRTAVVAFEGGAEFELSSSASSLLPQIYMKNTDNTAEPIRQCQKFILAPYANALKIIGWLPYRNSPSGYIWQVILVTIWFVCISSTMGTQILSCFKRDVLVPGDTISETMAYSVAKNGNGTPLAPDFKIIRCEEHIISRLILTNILILATYFYGIYLFVKGETDYLFGLADHVFIMNSKAQSSSKRLIRTIGVLFLLGIAWLLFSLTVRVMTAVSVQLFEEDVRIVWPHITFSGPLKISLLLISLFGFFTFDMVYMFSIMNYVAQAEMNIYLLWDVRKLIETKKYDKIDDSIKDAQKCKVYLDNLNGKTAALTGLSLFVLCQLGVTAIIDLLNVEETEKSILSRFKVLAALSSVLNVVCWCSPVALPFVQAARVTYWCDQLKDLGPEIRGRVSVAYANTNLLDLDSLFSFLQHIKLRASIFGVPISPRLLYLVLTAFSFTMLLLLQQLNTHTYI